MNENIQEKYEDLLHSYKKRGWKIEDLEKEIDNLRRQLSEAQRTIHTELEPRIESEKSSYDFYVTSQFKGTNGEPCNQDCSNCINSGCENNPEYETINKELTTYIKANEEGFAAIQINENEAMILTKVKLHNNNNKSFDDKIKNIPQDAILKLKETLSKIINENEGGMIVIML